MCMRDSNYNIGIFVSADNLNWSLLIVVGKNRSGWKSCVILARVVSETKYNSIIQTPCSLENASTPLH